MTLNIKQVNPQKGKTLMILGIVVIVAAIIVFLIQVFLFKNHGMPKILYPIGILVFGIILIIWGKVRHWIYNK
jgi:protein-S-isoprenylcysteine O-methyltransferase Ste14